MGRIGDSIERREDPALVTGTAAYLDDLSEPGVLHAAVVRSQYAHAGIAAIDTSGAESIEGVAAVYTRADLDRSGIPGTIPVGTSLPDPGGPDSPVTIRSDLVVPPRPLLAGDRARYAGQPVAVALADDRYVAAEAAGAVDVDYDPLEAVADVAAARADDAPAVHDEAPDNLVFDWAVGDAAAVDEAFAAADRTVSIDRGHQRLVSNSLEPRGALATYRSGRLDVAVSTQIPHMQQFLFGHVLGLPERRVRIRVPDVGGGFGAKSKYYPEEILAGWCAMQQGRPVKWQDTRSGAFHSDAQGRAHQSTAELAVTDDGDVLGLRVDDFKDVGAFVQRGAPAINTGSYATLLSGQYRIPAIYARVRGVFTNLPPTDAYRGSSRPEGVYVIERLMDAAARDLGMDPAELRRRNLVPADAFPYETPVLATYDSGDYEPALDEALSIAGYDALRARQRELRAESRYLGIGLASFVEPAGSSPVGPKSGSPGVEPAHIESSTVRFYPDGSVAAYCGTADQGQGHATTYAQIVADELGVDYDDVEILEGDTDHAGSGVGAHSSRSVIMAGSSLVESARKVIEQARPVAANRLEADEADVEFADGEFRVAGAPGRSVAIADVAEDAYFGRHLPDGAEAGLGASTYYGAEGKTWPFGTHIAVVEVDPETGAIDLERYVAVDDCGVQINPKLVAGQLHGGVAQGVGQALYEAATFDGSGTLLTGSFMDYAMPRAHHLPDLELGHTVTPSPLNPLGAKGTGEAGTVGAPVAVVNAVIDALEPFGVDHIDMPVTPERVWRAAAP